MDLMCVMYNNNIQKITIKCDSVSETSNSEITDIALKLLELITCLSLCSKD